MGRVDGRSYGSRAKHSLIGEVSYGHATSWDGSSSPLDQPSPGSHAAGLGGEVFDPGRRRQRPLAKEHGADITDWKLFHLQP